MADFEAPSGCLQYFKDTFSSITSFNFDGRAKFSPGQDYSICFGDSMANMGKRTCGFTLRAVSWGLPVAQSEGGKCVSGEWPVSKKGKVCCTNSQSSYLGFVSADPQHRYREPGTFFVTEFNTFSSSGSISVANTSDPTPVGSPAVPTHIS